MISLLNAFHGIIETDASPHARTLRTGLWQKIKDTFFVFAGDFGVFCENEGLINDKVHLGLFDYPTLGIPFILQLLLRASIHKDTRPKNPVVKGIALFFMAILSIPFMIARYSIAAVMTLISSPIVTLVHFISLSLASTQKERILRLPVSVTVTEVVPLITPGYKTQTTKKSQKEQTIGSYLQASDLNIEDVVILNVAMSDSENKTSKKLTLDFRKKLTSIPHAFDSRDNIDFSYNALFDPAESNHETVKKDIRALIDLNIGGVTAKLEKTPKILDVLQINCR